MPNAHGLHAINFVSALSLQNYPHTNSCTQNCRRILERRGGANHTILVQWHSNTLATGGPFWSWVGVVHGVEKGEHVLSVHPVMCDATLVLLQLSPPRALPRPHCAHFPHCRVGASPPCSYCSELLFSVILSPTELDLGTTRRPTNFIGDHWGQKEPCAGGVSRISMSRQSNIPKREVPRHVCERA